MALFQIDANKIRIMKMKLMVSLQNLPLYMMGGKSSTMLIDDLDIDSLRKFQLPGYAGQDAKGIFKNTPPLFCQKDVKTRIEDKDFK